MNQPRKPHGAPAKPEAINWREVCRKMLQSRRQLASNLLISGIEITIKDELGNIEDDFLNNVLAKGQSYKSGGKRLTIIGEPGVGKTTQLLKIADWLLDDTPSDTETEFVKPLPIWISLAQVKKPLHQYLREDWLREAAKELDSAPSAWVEEFTQLLKDGKVCLLLDGADEMGVPALLGTLAQSRISPLLNNVLMVISCRLNVWEAAGNTLGGTLWYFDTYKMLGFSYRESSNRDQVKQFIDKWFNKYSSILSDVERSKGSQLRAALNESGKERIKDLARYPLHLSLLCFTWQSRQRKLPDTKAELYQIFVEALYESKNSVYPTTPAQRKNLNAALGQLAMKAIDQGYKSILPYSLVNEALEKLHPELFEQALTLGWLNPVGGDTLNPLKSAYVFYHPTLLEYFAACEIEDWQFFLKPLPHNIERDNYRIFEPRWKEVFLLWLGRLDVPAEQKEELINSLIEFEDRCGDWDAIDRANKGFYEFRAYFLAAAGITEFCQYSKSDEIVRQIVKWGFGYVNKQQEWQTYLNPIQEAARDVLPQTQRSKVITALVELTCTCQPEGTRRMAAESLGNIDPGNSDAIGALVELIGNSQSPETPKMATESLVNIGTGNPTAIGALVEFIGNCQSEDTCWRVAESLGKIDPGNSDAIRALVELTRNSQSEFTRRMAAESLGKIGTGNSDAIRALVELICNCQDKYTRSRAAYSLREIGTGNPDAIAALVELTRNCQDKYTRRIAAGCLEEIGIGNPDAIAAFVELIHNSQSERMRYWAAESLGNIDPGNSDAIAAFVELIRNSESEGMRYWAVDSLRNIDPGNSDAITALVELIRNCQDEEIRGMAAGCLGNIGTDNSDAITALVELIRNCQSEDTRSQAAYSLEYIGTGNPDAITALVELTRNSESEDTRYWAAKCLRKLDPGNSDAIAALVELTRNCQDEDTYRMAAGCLGNIGTGNPDAISALVELIRNCQSEDTRSQAAYSLEYIGIGNPDAITALVELTRNCQSEDTRYWAAKCLGKLDPGNRDAIRALVELVTNSQDEDTHSRVAECLEYIGIGNPDAIRALVELVTNSQDEYTRWRVAESLQKVDPGNTDAIRALVELIGNSQHDEARWRAVHSLQEIVATQKQLLKVVSAVKDCLSDETYENDLIGFYEYYKVIWQCAQSLPYPDFYQAWHRQPPTHPEMPDITTWGNTPEAQ
ncbi:HEAT repeat domain-containing protein [Microcoleus sp. FACHB-68]|uniref:HEAT repeat domain-containing protein n=1 Tax=Microcoleus sp. FACHB-68 TaxID=2692826 RepID=UPI00168524AE|nr:HEAT repeat domain-containing protein [Microcoleus sp. FACHB-68]MBD1939555.1 HEAT repeat domain-containing protein [Microcoleus sp. FACHB-68]